MSREIKFRWWNNKIRQMAGWEEMLKECNRLSMLNPHSDMSEWIPMQFTGLKDKNGVEIYEGDVIDNGNGPTYVFYNENYQAFWVGFDDENEEKQFYIALWDYEGDIEILGNIYENPGLLKEPTP